MVAAADPAPIRLRHKAITAFFPYAARQEQNGQNEMLEILLRTVRASRKQGFIWHRIRPPITTLLGGESPISVKRAIVLVSPHLPWWDRTIDGDFIRLWAAAACAVPYAHDVGQSVVDTLLLIASQDPLRPHIPVGMWSWLNRRPYPPPAPARGSQGTERNVVRTVRSLGDVGILTSYLLLVWSEGVDLYQDGLDEMCASIREDFSGIGMAHHRKDLLQHLDRVLDHLDPGLGPTRSHEQGLSGDVTQSMKDQYKRLNEVLLEVDGEVTNLFVGLPDWSSSSEC